MRAEQTKKKRGVLTPLSYGKKRGVLTPLSYGLDIGLLYEIL